MTSFVAADLSLTGLSREHQDILNRLNAQLTSKYTRNDLRRRYRDYHIGLKDLGISIPPALRTLDTVLGWPAKAVETLARRTVVENFTVPGGSADSLGVTELVDQNQLASDLPQAISDAYTFATSFVSVSLGNKSTGEPPVLILPRSAMYATGLWDPRRRGLSSGLSVVSSDATTGAACLILYLPDRVLTLETQDGRGWQIEDSPNPLGFVTMFPLPYKPSLDHPFGRSRISRPVMSLTDSAVRTLVRAEVSAEFYSSPQRWVMGADESAFKDKDGKPIPAWQATLGRVWALGPNTEDSLDGTPITPSVGQFTQQSMEPHMSHLRQLAQSFASETSLPISALGIVQDNPSSAEAIYASEKDLVIEAEYANLGFSGPLQRAIKAALMLTGVPAEEAGKVRASFRNPAHPTAAASADAAIKLIGAGVIQPDSEVTYDMLNFPEAQREVLRAEARRARASLALSSLLTPKGAVDGQPIGDSPAAPAEPTNQPAVTQ